MKYYIATKLENYAAHTRLSQFLTGLGHECTYDWTVHGAVYGSGLGVVSLVAAAEIAGVADADVVIVLWPGGRGTHAELGAAIALGKTVLFLSDVEDHHGATPETCCFYHHPSVRRFRSDLELVKWVMLNHWIMVEDVDL